MLSVGLVIVFSLLTILTFYVATKATYFRLDARNGYVWSVLLYRELFTVFSAIFLAAVYGVGAFGDAIINATDDHFPVIALVSIYSIFAFGVSFSLFANHFRVPAGMRGAQLAFLDTRVRQFANAALLSGFTLFFFAYFFLSYRHAFISSIFTGDGLISVRLINAYGTRLPSQIAQIISVSWWIVAIYVGGLIHKKSALKALFYGVAALFLASARGDKAPVMMCFVIVGLSYVSVRGLKVSGGAIVKSLLLYFPVMYAVFFWVVSLQIPDLTIIDFNFYLLNRLGIGQMSGVFETFSISRLDGDFYWHAVPGASFFVDYIPYDKKLMMATEGYGYTEMGVKNSLFISEAYGIGGSFLVVVAPFIVGFSYAFGMFFLYLFLANFFGRSVAILYATPLYVISSSITGGFSSFPLFKGLLLEIICLGVIWLVYSAIGMLRRLKLAGRRSV